jgi:hypothetical protein
VYLPYAAEAELIVHPGEDLGPVNKVAQTAPSRSAHAVALTELEVGLSGETLAKIAHLHCVGVQLKFKLEVPPAAVWVPGITMWPSIGAWNVLLIDEASGVYLKKPGGRAEVRREYMSGEVETSYANEPA